MAEPPLDAVYAVVFIDAINVKIREARSQPPIYLRWASPWTRA